MRGEGMPQDVRTHPAAKTRLARVAGQDLPEAHPAELPTEAVHEYRGLGPAARKLRPSCLEIAPECPRRSTAEGHESLLVPLSHHVQEPVLEIDGFERQARDLRGAQPARVRELEHGAVAQLERLLAQRLGEQALD